MCLFLSNYTRPYVVVSMWRVGSVGRSSMFRILMKNVLLLNKHV